MNPILQMLNSSKTSTDSALPNLENFPLAKLGEFAKLMQRRHPEQLLQNYIKQNNITDAQYQHVAGMSRQICNMFGLR